MNRDTVIYWGIGLFCTAMIALVFWALADMFGSDTAIVLSLLFLFLWILMSFKKVQGILDFKRRKDNLKK